MKAPRTRGLGGCSQEYLWGSKGVGAHAARLAYIIRRLGWKPAFHGRAVPGAGGARTRALCALAEPDRRRRALRAALPRRPGAILVGAARDHRRPGRGPGR